MTTSHDQHDPHDDLREPTLPEGLVTLLRSTHGADRAGDGEKGVEARVDDAVMRVARERLERTDDEAPAPIPFPYWARALSASLGLAAVMALIVWFGQPVSSPSAPSTSGPAGPPARSLSEPSKELGDELATGESAARRRTFDNETTLDALSPALREQPLETLDQGAWALAEGEALPLPVTILDAYTLALALDAGEDVDPSLDRNADGVVDDADVDALAFAAVRLVELDDRGDAGWTGASPVLGAAFWRAHPFGGSVMR